MFERTHLQEVMRRLDEPRKFIQVLMGPRQVGKTTLTTQLLDKKKIAHHFVSADAVAASNHVWLQQQWEVARLKMDNFC